MVAGLGEMTPLVMVKKAEVLWETWNIRVCILVSLLIQACLTFSATWRKSRATLGLFIWMLYLSADGIAVYTIGLITNSHNSISESTELLVFWAPFLLIHLGGPDTITALALEDNELWLRHLLQFCSQVLSTLYVFSKTLHTNKLRVATLFMLLDGCLKYLERTTSLYQASMDSFRDSLQRHPDPGPNYATLMEEYSSMKEANIPVDIFSSLENIEEDHHDGDGDHNNMIESSHGGHAATTSNIDEIQLVNKAYEFYFRFRGLIADIMFTKEDRDKSRSYFLRTDIGAQQAFKVIQIELNFIYDAFYTKVNVLWKERRVTRSLSVLFLFVAFYLFYYKDKRHYHQTDVYITYVLLGGAFFMDVAAFFMFILSDWFVIALTRHKKQRHTFLTSVLQWLLKHRPPRWSNKVSQYDLLDYCLNDHSTLLGILRIKSLKDVVTNALYVSRGSFNDDLRDDIYKELITKAKNTKAKDAKKVSEARGNLIFLEKNFDGYSEMLRPWTTDVNFDESLLLWHVATDLCISTDLSSNNCQPPKYCEYSKKLSDYMLYLLIMQPSMTSAVAGIAQVRFQDTCAETKKFIRRKLPQEKGKIKKVKGFLETFYQLLGKFSKWLFNGLNSLFCSCCLYYKAGTFKTEDQSSIKNWDPELKKLCMEIVDVKAYWKPEKVKGDTSKSVLFDACRLAMKLNQLKEEDKWEVIFKVWVELLCYAASRCTPTSHVQHLRQGGELITLVWLLMAHLGFGEQFRINQGTGWAKLVVQDPFGSSRSVGDNNIV